jgi:adenylate/guanylate cyclase family protein/AAA ATPase-like protein
MEEINTGQVVIGAIGDNLRMDYTAVGDTTNLAARLEQQAAPGAILVSSSTSRALKGEVDLEALGEIPLKGKTEPVAVWRVRGLAQRRSPERHGALSPFAGRARELAVLEDLLNRAEGGEGQVAGVLGEPGLGESRLLLEFRTRIGHREPLYLEGRCLSYAQTVPLVPVLD